MLRRRAGAIVLSAVTFGLAAPGDAAPGYVQPGAWGYPGATQGQPQRRPQARTQGQQRYRQPRAEVEVSDTSPYIQQPVIYTVRAYTGGNVKTISVDLPAGDHFKVRSLDSETRETDEEDYPYLTVARYAVTPLRPGEREGPVAEVSGTFHEDTVRGSQEFQITASNSPELAVQPANSTVRPWLPLRSLDIRADVQVPPNRRVGEPVTLTVTLEGEGLGGKKLPSLATRLESADYKLYPESTESYVELGDGSQALQGRRVEHYTLVPKDDAAVRLPQVQVPWWNVETGQREWAVLDSPVLKAAAAPASPSAAAAPATSRRQPVDLFLVLIGALCSVFASWLWLWLWLQNIRVGSRITAFTRDRVVSPLHAAVNRARWRVTRSMPARVMCAAPRRVIEAIPASARLRWSLWRVEEESDPADWAGQFQRCVARFLELPPQTAIHQLGEALIARGWCSDPRTLRRALRQLEAHLYGGQTLYDFEAWKRSVRAVVGAPSQRRSGGRHPGLPALNP